MRVAFLFFFLCLCAPTRAAESINLALPSGAELQVQRHAAARPDAPLLLWLTGEYGPIAAEAQAAADLARRGVEVHLADWLAPYFLPQLPRSLGEIPDADLSAWLAETQRRYPERRLMLLAAGHAAEPLLRAAARWPGAQQHAPLPTVLLFPLLYRGVDAGAEPEYAPVVDATRLDLALLVPKASAGYWWRERLQARLEAAGSHVRQNVLNGMRDGFYRRSDASETETAAGARLGDLIHSLLQPWLPTAP